MANSPPADPKVNDSWVDDAGELFYWDGQKWARYADPPGAPRDGEPQVAFKVDE